MDLSIVFSLAFVFHFFLHNWQWKDSVSHAEEESSAVCNVTVRDFRRFCMGISSWDLATRQCAPYTFNALFPRVALSPTTSLYAIISSAPWGGCFKNSQQCRPVCLHVFPTSRPKTRLANKSSWMPRDLKGSPRNFTSCVERGVGITQFKGRLFLQRVVSGNSE